VARSLGTIGHPRFELSLLVLASVAVVGTLCVAVADGTLTGFPAQNVTFTLLVTIAGGLIALGGGAVIYLRQKSASVRPRSDRDEMLRLRRELAAKEAMIDAEPQVLAFWDSGQRVQIMIHSLAHVPGVPRDPVSLERFGGWLETSAAVELKSALDTLFADGRAFNLLVRTKAGAHLEADGRTASGRSVLRFRDAVGHKNDLARILDQQRALTREIRAGRALLDALPMPVWHRSADGKLDWVNASYLKAVEVDSLEEVRRLGVELLEVRERQRVSQVVASGGVYRERMALFSRGERKSHDVVVLPIEGASVGAAIDVAAIETARGELDRQIAAYDRTLHRVASGVAIFGPDRRLSFFNDSYAQLWQLDADWLSSCPSDSEILDRLRALSRLPEVVNYRDWKSKVLAAPAAGTEFEDWWHLNDGRTIHVLAEQRPDGGVTVLYDDATERLALESRYNALIDAQRETLDNLTEAVAVFAPNGRLKLFNSAFAQIWRLSRATLGEGPHIDEIIKQCSVLLDDTTMWTIMSRSVTGISDRRQPEKGHVTRPDQSVIDYAISPLPDGATLITFVDVTDAKRYERTLIERNDALIAADRLKSTFISHISYELRTPLTNIIGFSEFLGSPLVGPLNLRQAEYLGDISASSQTLLTVINDILDLTTIDAGNLELKLQPHKVRDLIDRSMDAVQERASRARVTFDVSVAPDAEAMIADGPRVTQVLTNLLSNAIGFSVAGEAVKVAAARDGAMLVLTVADNGVGIPKEQQARVFDRFESRSLGSRHRGAGLGLAIVKSLVELHGGTMTLQSETGHGTRAIVRLPMAPADLAAAMLAESNEPSRRKDPVFASKTKLAKSA
jgi:signal transduction histidine kinase